jgi:hypothetical protein
MNETHVGPTAPLTTAAPSGPLFGTLAHFSWRATLAGVVVAVAAQILLTLLGVALGITTITASGSPDVARGAGIGVGIWYLISMILSIFLGGLVAGLAARDVSRLGGIIEGIVVWAATIVLAVWLVSQGVSQALLHAGVIASQASQAASQASPDASQGLQDSLQNPQTLRQVGTASAAGAWIAFVTLVLSALAGIFGGITGTRRNFRRVAEGPPNDWRRRGERRTVPTTAPPLRPSEA